MPLGDEPFSITGGNETVTVGGYTYVVFTSSGTATLNNAIATTTVGVCTVGGGGGAGYDIGGGGGGGELDLFANFTVTQNLTITIGASGAFAASPSVKGSNGGTSTVVEGTTLQSALGGGGGGSYSDNVGLTGGSGSGGSGSGGAGGGASGSNTFAGGTGAVNGAGLIGGGGGGATAVGVSGATTGNGGQGYALATIDANLTSANFPTTLTGKTYVSSGGAGGVYNLTNAPLGGTNAGDGGKYLPSSVNATSPTSYGCGGGGGQLNTAGTSGYAGLVILRYAV